MEGVCSPSISVYRYIGDVFAFQNIVPTPHIFWSEAGHWLQIGLEVCCKSIAAGVRVAALEFL